MKTIVGWLILLASLWFGLRPAHAYVYGEFGMAFDHKYETQYSQVKQVEFGHIVEGKTFNRNFSIGAWTDYTHVIGIEKRNVYVQYQLSLETRRHDLPYWYYSLGPAFVSNPDLMLGSHFQVSHELGWGAVDGRGVRFGFYLKHFSNGGLSSRNEGRNFVGIRAGF